MRANNSIQNKTLSLEQVTMSVLTCSVVSQKLDHKSQKQSIYICGTNLLSDIRVNKVVVRTEYDVCCIS